MHSRVKIGINQGLHVTGMGLGLTHYANGIDQKPELSKVTEYFNVILIATMFIFSSGMQALSPLCSHL